MFPDFHIDQIKYNHIGQGFYCNLMGQFCLLFVFLAPKLS